MPDERSTMKKVWQFPLVAMLVAIAIMIACVSLVSVASAPDLTGLGIQEAYAVFAILLVLLCLAAYKLVIRKLGRTKHDDLPLDWSAIRDSALGFGGGALLISICVGLAALFGVYRIERTDDFGDGLQIIFLFGVYAGFFEELLLRGIVFRWLEEMAGSWIALALSALIFGFLHAGNDNATFFSSLAISIEAGILLGAAYMLTRSLWLAIGLHAGWNVVQALWDVPVSGNDVESVIEADLSGPSLLAGGGFGLEATVFAVVVATSAGIALLVLAARRGRIVAPMWRRDGPITAY